MAAALKIHMDDIREVLMPGKQISHSTEMKSFSLSLFFFFRCLSSSLMSHAFATLFLVTLRIAMALKLRLAGRQTSQHVDTGMAPATPSRPAQPSAEVGTRQ